MRDSTTCKEPVSVRSHTRRRDSYLWIVLRNASGPFRIPTLDEALVQSTILLVRTSGSCIVDFRYAAEGFKCFAWPVKVLAIARQYRTRSTSCTIVELLSTEYPRLRSLLCKGYYRQQTMHLRRIMCSGASVEHKATWSIYPYLLVLLVLRRIIQG